MSSDDHQPRTCEGLLGTVGKWVFQPAQWYFSWKQPTIISAIIELPDGARLAYDILGAQHLGNATPVVMICGMTALKGDDERVNKAVAKSHPVLVYDHRGMGGSSLTPAGNEEITIELLARDLLFLLKNLGWKEVALCGYSMGGVVAQQLLVLPYLPTNPTPLSFHTTHLFLVATRCKPNQGAGLPITAVPGKPRSLEERREGAKRVIAATLDPAWVKDNTPRFDEILARVVNNNLSNRPAEMIAQQSMALKKFDFVQHLEHLPRGMRVLIIHGRLDQVIPFSCAGDTISHIPWAQLVQEGFQPGQVPTLQFGHLWYEYFNPQVWHDVLHEFIRPGPE